MKTIVKYFLTIIFFVHFSTVINATKKVNLAEINDCTNHVLIQGSSNINQFELVNLNPIFSKDTNKQIAYYSEKKIQIPVNEFTATNKMILNDFFEMVKIEKFPHINIEIESRDNADFDETTGLTNFKVEISLAGETHEYIVPCELKNCDQSGLTLNGDLEIKLSDFNIDPPQKLFGTVKVDNKVFIKFAFRYF